MATRKKHFYTAPDGTEYPVKEADYAMGFKVYKTDRSKAIKGDPTHCLIAMGLQRHPEVQYAFIGSGLDAYVVFRGKRGRPAYAVHFTIPAQASKVRDAFDAKQGLKTMFLELRAPTAGRTLDARARQDRRRRLKIKNGTHTVKPRGPSTKRVTRIGVPHRPRPRITTSGDVHTEVAAAV
jgi:hypothetical protein